MTLLSRNRVHRQPFAGHSVRWWKEKNASDHAHRDPVVQRLYDSKAWKTIRAQVLIDAGGRCATPMCAQTPRIVDHRKPHRGMQSLFFDMGNLQALCKTCHDRKTATYDRGFGNATRQRK